jgi:hypothetical protein
LRALPEATERLLYAADALPSARGLVLAGGTALALRLHHRISGDLDFVFGTERLPQKRVKLLLDALKTSRRVEPMANVAAEQDFLDSGLDLADYQQDYNVDGVKLTFFVAEPMGLGPAIKAESGIAGLKRIQVADIGSLFLMKAVALASRSTIRDLFDVYTLIEHQGYPAQELFEAVERFGYSSDALKTRLLNASRRKDDPGIETLTGEAPTLAQLKAYFADLIDSAEQTQAEQLRPRPPRG